MAPAALLLERLILVVGAVVVATAEVLMVAGLIDKSFVLVAEVAEEVTLFVKVGIVVVAAIWEVIRVNAVVGLGFSEIEGTFGVASMAAVLVTCSILTVTESDSFNWAVIFDFMIVFVGSGNVVVFLEASVLVTGAVALVVLEAV